MNAPRDRFGSALLLTLALALLLGVGGCVDASGPSAADCPDPYGLGLERSPLSGRCSVEGSDDWYGCTDDCTAPYATENDR